MNALEKYAAKQLLIEKLAAAGLISRIALAGRRGAHKIQRGPTMSGLREGFDTRRFIGGGSGVASNYVDKVGRRFKGVVKPRVRKGLEAYQGYRADGTRILGAPARYQRAHQVGVATRRATEGLKRGWGKTRSKLKKLVPGLSGAAAVKSFHNT